MNRVIFILNQQYVYKPNSKVIADVNEVLLFAPYDQAFDYATMLGCADIDHQDKDAIGEFRDMRGGVIRNRITLFDGYAHYCAMCSKYGLEPILPVPIPFAV